MIIFGSTFGFAGMILIAYGRHVRTPFDGTVAPGVAATGGATASGREGMKVPGGSRGGNGAVGAGCCAIAIVALTRTVAATEVSFDNMAVPPGDLTSVPVMRSD